MGEGDEGGDWEVGGDHEEEFYGEVGEVVCCCELLAVGVFL